jgi:CrcB protein
VNQVIAVAVGGALGALSRYWMVGLVSRLLARDFPYGTLTVNVIGSFLIGIGYIVIVEKLHVASEWHAVLMVGFVGAFTTFSTFSLETVSLLQEGRFTAALIYIFSSVLVCLLATAAGIVLAKQFV